MLFSYEGQCWDLSKCNPIGRLGSEKMLSRVCLLFRLNDGDDFVLLACWIRKKPFWNGVDCLFRWKTLHIIYPAGFTGHSYEYACFVFSCYQMTEVYDKFNDQCFNNPTMETSYRESYNSCDTGQVYRRNSLDNPFWMKATSKSVSHIHSYTYACLTWSIVCTWWKCVCCFKVESLIPRCSMTVPLWSREI